MDTTPKPTFWQRLRRSLDWTQSSYILLSGFLLTCFLIVYIWWPLAEEYLSYVDWSGKWWLQLDWLLLGVFLFMSLMIMAGADLKADLPIIMVGLAGGLVIESWGTQTELWTYYTLERPPLWIIPAWPIASLSIDRMARITHQIMPDAWDKKHFMPLYIVIFSLFTVLMVGFVWWTGSQSLTIMALVMCAFLILTPTDWRLASITFLMGAGLGYFLELWGTTRWCWTYYTGQQPPLFAVLAHGMAAVAFWRVKEVLLMLWSKQFSGSTAPQQ